MANTKAISKLTNNLVEYLIEVLADKSNDARQLAYRYNNLKVYMNPKDVRSPHFFVSMGISEACFALEGAIKMEGSLGFEEGYVQRWANRPNVQSELKAQWKFLKDEIEKEKAAEEMKLRQLKYRERNDIFDDEDDDNLNLPPETNF